MIDKETLAKLGGTITTIHVGYSVKAWMDGQSKGCDVGMDMVLPPEADPEVAVVALYEYEKQTAHRAMGDDLKLVLQPLATAKQTHEAAVAQAAVPIKTVVANLLSEPERLPALDPTRVPMDDDGNEYKDIVVDHIKVIFSEEGEKRARTFGKPWMQYGAITYPETLAAVGFDLEAASGGVHQLPKPYAKARVLLGEKNAKGFDVPKKVVAFLE